MTEPKAAVSPHEAAAEVIRELERHGQGIFFASQKLDHALEVVFAFGGDAKGVSLYLGLHFREGGPYLFGEALGEIVA